MNFRINRIQSAVASVDSEATAKCIKVSTSYYLSINSTYIPFRSYKLWLSAVLLSLVHL